MIKLTKEYKIEVCLPHQISEDVVDLSENNMNKDMWNKIESKKPLHANLIHLAEISHNNDFEYPRIVLIFLLNAGIIKRYYQCISTKLVT